MTRDAIVAQLERYTEALARLDARAAAALFVPDGVLLGPSAGVSHGRAAIARTFGQWMAAFPDIVFDFEKPIIDGDRAARAYRMQGTQNGPFFGLPGTHRHVEGQGLVIFQLSPDGFRHVRYIYDFSGMLIQAGVLRARPSVEAQR